MRTFKLSRADDIVPRLFGGRRDGEQAAAKKGAWLIEAAMASLAIFVVYPRHATAVGGRFMA